MPYTNQSPQHGELYIKFLFIARKMFHVKQVLGIFLKQLILVELAIIYDLT